MQDQSQIKVTVGIQQCRVHLPKAGVLIIKERIYLTQKRGGITYCRAAARAHKEKDRRSVEILKQTDD